MFHCNGWCFPWTIALRAGVNVCLRKVEAGAIFDAMRAERVTHYCGAPIVHSMLVNAPAELRAGLDHRIDAMVAGAAPPSSMIEGLGRHRHRSDSHLWSHRDVRACGVVRAQEDWAQLDPAERARKKARQGVGYHLQEELTVIDPETGIRVPADGQTLGEVAFRGNIAMKATSRSRGHGQGVRRWVLPEWRSRRAAARWLREDHRSQQGRDHLGRRERIEPRDRGCTVQAPGGCRGGGRGQARCPLGRDPCAFLELKPGCTVTPEESGRALSKVSRGFQDPRAFEFGEVPKTATGKIQKFELRRRVDSVSAIDV